MSFTPRQQLVDAMLDRYHKGNCKEECSCDIAEGVYQTMVEEQLKFAINGDY